VRANYSLKVFALRM